MGVPIRTSHLGLRRSSRDNIVHDARHCIHGRHLICSTKRQMLLPRTMRPLLSNRRPRIPKFTARMATIRSSLPHEDRTSSEPREKALEAVVLSNIRQINDNIKLLRLSTYNPNHTIKVLPPLLHTFDGFRMLTDRQ